LSPDIYRQLREEDERHAAQTRLRTYFFGDLWEELPENGQNALIAADRTYWATEGRRDDVFENLRIAVESVVDKVLATPFRLWLKQKPSPTNDAQTRENRDREPLLPISRLIDELWEENSAAFQEFTKVRYPDVDPQFWNDLERDLTLLRNLRSRAVHPEDRGAPRAQAIAYQYGKYLGIGNQGIIRTLLNLEAKRKYDK